MPKKNATSEQVHFRDEHFMRTGDTLTVQRTLHKDELTYRVTATQKRTDGWHLATLELLVDRSKDAAKFVRHPEAITTLIKKNESKLDFKKSKPDSHTPSSHEMRKLIEEFERAYLGV